MHEYMDVINDLYYDRLIKIFKKHKTRFLITRDNALLMRHTMDWIYRDYISTDLGYIVFDDDLHYSWKVNIKSVMDVCNNQYQLSGNE